MKENELLAWIDIETTGLNVQSDDLLEVAVIVTDRDLIELGRRNWVLNWPFDPVETGVVPFVIDMHTENGLWNACLASNIGSGLFEELMADFLQSILDENPFYEKFVMAGSGVARFDYTWFQLNFPDLIKRFSYYTFDISVVRRALELSGVILEKADEVSTAENLSHRAMDDIEDHLAEWKVYRGVLARLNNG